MDVRHLQHFLAVIEYGSLKRAAEVVNVSQQGLSSSIKTLEGSVKVKLFERGRLGAVPTVYGRALAEHARLICGQMRLAKSELTSLAAADTGTAAVGVGAFFAQRIMPAAIVKLAETKPAIVVRAVEGPSDMLYRLLLEGDIDFATSTPSGAATLHPDLQQRVLFEDRDAPLVRIGHPLAGRGQVSFADLARHPWLFSARYTADREWVLRSFAAAGVAPPRRMVLTDSPSMLSELLRTGDYIHVTGRSHLLQALSNIELVELPVPALNSRRVGVITLRRHERMAPASRSLLDAFEATWESFARLRTAVLRSDR